jgi:hypothetical protein
MGGELKDLAWPGQPELMAEGEGFEPPRASRPGGFQVHCLAS